MNLKQTRRVADDAPRLTRLSEGVTAAEATPVTGGRGTLARRSTMSQVSRYHPLLVSLHWLLALVILAALALGAVKMVHIPNSDPMKIEALRSHMAGGIAI